MLEKRHESKVDYVGYQGGTLRGDEFCHLP